MNEDDSSGYNVVLPQRASRDTKAAALCVGVGLPLPFLGGPPLGNILSGPGRSSSFPDNDSVQRQGSHSFPCLK